VQTGGRNSWSSAKKKGYPLCFQEGAVSAGTDGNNVAHRAQTPAVKKTFSKTRQKPKANLHTFSLEERSGFDHQICLDDLEAQDDSHTCPLE
jgi:hypothetical protein